LITKLQHLEKERLECISKIDELELALTKAESEHKEEMEFLHRQVEQLKSQVGE
jgi:hypothetical protein